MTCGIYKIINIVTGKFYLGSSKDLETRWNRHLYELRSNRHHSIHLQRSFNKHGESVFKFEIIKQLDNNIEEKELFKEEQQYLNDLTPWKDNIGYNMSKSSDGGDLVSYHPNIEAIREKQRINTTERWNNMTEQEKIEYGEKMKRDGNPNWRGGKTFMECPVCGKKYRVSTKRNTCNKCRNRSGELNPFYGKQHSDETKEKLRQNNLGKINSYETKEKCKQASINFYNSEIGKQFKKEQSMKMKGEKHFLFGIGHTEDSKNKISNTKIEKFKNMTVEDRINRILNSKQNIKMILAEENYFLSSRECSEYYKLSQTAIEFRCKSLDIKWNNFKYISKEELLKNKDIIMLNIKQRLERSVLVEDCNLPK